MNRRDFLQTAAVSAVSAVEFASGESVFGEAASSAATSNETASSETASNATASTSVDVTASSQTQSSGNALGATNASAENASAEEKAPPQVFRNSFKGGLSVPSLGFGVFRLPTDPKISQKLVDMAMASGVNYFDTAYTYLGGKAEELCAQLLSGYARESYFFTTKMPPMYEGNKPEDLTRIFDDQLRRSRVEYFDFYLCHNLQKNSWAHAKRVGMVDFLQKKKEEGKIRNLGFSFHDAPEILAEIADFHSWDFALIQLNYFDWIPYRSGEQYEILRKRNIPICVMEPLRGGLLANLGEKGNAVFKKANPSATVASWAFRYVASLPGVFTVLSGMDCMEHLTENIQTFSNFKPITEAEKEVIRCALEAYGATGFIPCTDCKYCLPCPLEINIPSVFTVYNQFRNTINVRPRVPGIRQMEMEMLAQATSCVSCKQCLNRCPQKINIPAAHRKVVKDGMKRNV